MITILYFIISWAYLGPSVLAFTRSRSGTQRYIGRTSSLSSSLSSPLPLPPWARGDKIDKTDALSDDSLQQRDPTWWQVDDAEKRNNATSVATAVIVASTVIHEEKVVDASPELDFPTPVAWKPNTQAWRTTLSDPLSRRVEDAEEIQEVEKSCLMDEEHPLPPTLPEYFQGIKKIGPLHERNIASLWVFMKNRGSLRHLTGESSIKVVEALRIAYITLWGKQTIRSLEVSINRARGTAAVLGELKGNVDVVLASILCDVLAQLSSDPDLAPGELSDLRDQLQERFGDDVIDLCDKYNRLPVFMSKKADYTPIQSENQLQMLVAVSEDYRALYVRLADRLHTLRTLKSLPLLDAERTKLAQEALHVYAPLAHRMGVMKVKGELEDLAFKTLNPVMFQSTKYTQIAANKAYSDAFDAVKNIMETDMYVKSQGATYKLTHRVKDKYQLFLKMQRKNLSSLNQVRDALGMRIVIDYARINGEGESEESYRERGNAICYHLIQELRKVPGWVPAERGLKDYIKNAKDNGYQSLHQYIRSVSLGTNVEIQVRTQAMDRQAELGEAAHWFYKDSIYRPEIAETRVYKTAWRSAQQVNAKSPAELIGMARQQLAVARVFVFLDDRSTVLNLPKGATSLDAAFALHSDVGLSLASVKVGGTQVGLNHILQNGEVVSFQSTAEKAVSVKPTWIDMVTTTNAQATIRKYYRDHNRLMLVCLGCVQLLMTMTLSTNAIAKRFPHGLPDAAKLARWASKRSQLRDISEVLVKLGTVSKSEAAHHIGGLLDVPAANLTVSSISLGLVWARMQGRNGWEDKDMQRNILLPLMQEILPPLLSPTNTSTGKSVEGMWAELVGARSLVEEDEPDSLISLSELSSPFAAPPLTAQGQELDFSLPYVIMAPPPVEKIHPKRANQKTDTMSGQDRASEGRIQGGDQTVDSQLISPLLGLRVSQSAMLSPNWRIKEAIELKKSRQLASINLRESESRESESLLLGASAGGSGSGSDGGMSGSERERESGYPESESPLQSHSHVHQVIATPAESGGAADVAASILHSVCDLATSGKGSTVTSPRAYPRTNTRAVASANAVSFIHSKSRSKFPRELVNKPFSLEAPALSVPLLKLARRKYVERLQSQQVVE